MLKIDRFFFQEESFLGKVSTLGRKKKTAQQLEQEAENEALEVLLHFFSVFAFGITAKTVAFFTLHKVDL